MKLLVILILFSGCAIPHEVSYGTLEQIDAFYTLKYLHFARKANEAKVSGDKISHMYYLSRKTHYSILVLEVTNKIIARELEVLNKINHDQ